MKLYRFSPIKSETKLLECINYLHEANYKLCKKTMNRYLPVRGNVGVFTHYDDEYNLLLSLSRKLTNRSVHLNNKYFKLISPIFIPAEGNIPPATYEFLCIRKPDPYRSQVGDIDYVISTDSYNKLKNSLTKGESHSGIRLFERPGDSMIELFDPDLDVLSYLVTKPIKEKSCE